MVERKLAVAVKNLNLIEKMPLTDASGDEEQSSESSDDDDVDVNNVEV